MRSYLATIENGPEAYVSMPDRGDGPEPSEAFSIAMSALGFGLLGTLLLPDFGEVNLSWHGHEFLALARCDSCWEKAIEHSRQSQGTATIEQILAIMEGEQLKALGLS
jgi:hypothetical protein